MSDGNVRGAERYLRVTPQSDLDLQLMITNNLWGQDEAVNKSMNPTLKDALRILSYLSRDLRLANMDKQELLFTRYYLELGGDIITENLNQESYDNEEAYIMIEPFIICLHYTASVTETSQSKGGFLRKMFNTLFSHTTQSTEEPPKKSLFTGKNKTEGNV